MNKFIQSSQNPNEVSMTVKGLVLAVLPLTITLLRNYGVQATQGEIIAIVDVTLQAIAGIMVVFGATRKIINSRK